MQYKVQRTEIFDKWLKKLRDRQAVLAIINRINRATAGNLGDVEPVGEGISEMHIFIGKGYRLYFCTQNNELIILLCGGDKSTQPKDIQKAKILAKDL
ncbi:MAG: type II toxin-antitoxin system RelE/ParE family toxin [Gammaproteobacteria bacterium]|nr:type II toxin-antitoxin system RelE/ParE family toxin [Gammaproteobacteria bacterium]